MDDNRVKEEDLNKKSPLGVTQPVRPAGNSGGPKGTGFTNIQSIIKANQGNRLGQAVAGGVQGQGQQVKQQAQQAGQKFEQGVAAGRLDTDANREKSQQLLSQAGSLQGGQALGEDMLAQGQTFLQGDYQGPRDVENSAQLAGRAAEAEQLGKLGGSSAGRQGLLQRFVGAPQYSFGQQKLDNLLLGASGADLAKARASTRGLAEQTIGGIQTARQQAQAVAGENAAFGKLFGEQALGARGGLEKQVKDARDAETIAEGRRSADYERLKTGIQQALNPQDQGPGFRAGDASIENLISGYSGMDDATKNKLTKVISDAQRIGANPTTAVNQILSGYEAASGDITSDAQRAQINALSRLAGKEQQTFGEAYKAGAGNINQDTLLNSGDALSRLEKSKADIGSSNNVYQKHAQTPAATSSKDLELYLAAPQKQEYEGIRYKLGKNITTTPEERAKFDAYNKLIVKTATAKGNQARAAATETHQASLDAFNARGY